MGPNGPLRVPSSARSTLNLISGFPGSKVPRLPVALLICAGSKAMYESVASGTNRRKAASDMGLRNSRS